MSELIKAGSVPKADYPNANDTDGVKAWMRYAASNRALIETNNIYTNYLAGAFNSWLISYKSYRAEEPYPGVPAAIDALVSDDGLAYDLVESTLPSGPTPTYEKRIVTAPNAGTIKSSVAIPGLLIGQIGVPLTQKDGTVWVRLS